MKRIENKNISNNIKREEAFNRAQKRLKELKGFYAHAFWYVVVNIFIVTMVVVNSDGDIWHFGTFATPFFWGIGLGFHALCIYGKNVFFSKSWEDKKIQEFMEKEERTNRKFE